MLGLTRRLPHAATGREVADRRVARARPAVAARRRLAPTSLVLLVAASAVGLLTAPVLGRTVDLVVDGRPARALPCLPPRSPWSR